MRIRDKLINNKSGICSNLSRTCCTTKDFNNLEKWWDNKSKKTNQGIKMSIKDIRQHKQEDLMIYTTKLIGSFGRMKKYAEEMVNPKKNKPDEFCVNVNEEFQAWEPDAKIFNKENYLKSATTCWNFLNTMQTTI